MFGIGTHEMIVILIIALIVIGPKQLPEIARMLGKGMAVLRKARDELTDELKGSIDLDRHVSRFRSDVEKYIEDEVTSMDTGVGENGSAFTAQEGNIPVHQQQEAQNANDHEANDKESTPSDEEPPEVSKTVYGEAEKVDQPGEGAEPKDEKGA